MCNKKTLTKLEAIQAIAVIRLFRRTRGNHRRRNEKRYYFCCRCDAYHLTSQRKKKKRRKMSPFNLKLRFKALRYA